MLQFYLILIGMYLYYSKSKYFPNFLFQPGFPGLSWVAMLFTICGTALFVGSDGWASGLLLALAACTLGMGIVQLFAVLGKVYFYGLAAVVHVLLILDLLSHAS